MFRALIEIVIFLIAIAVLYWLFWQYVYPWFSKDKKPGWLTDHEKVEDTKESNPIDTCSSSSENSNLEKNQTDTNISK